MNHVTRDGDYESYLLRLWRDGSGATWRASLQSSATGQIHHFASVEALFIFLSARLCDDDISVFAPPRQ